MENKNIVNTNEIEKVTEDILKDPIEDVADKVLNDASDIKPNEDLSSVKASLVVMGIFIGTCVAVHFIKKAIKKKKEKKTESDIVADYCKNDVMATEAAYNNIKNDI